MLKPTDFAMFFYGNVSTTVISSICSLFTLFGIIETIQILFYSLTNELGVFDCNSLYLMSIGIALCKMNVVALDDFF